jgi:hypothetical protein
MDFFKNNKTNYRSSSSSCVFCIAPFTSDAQMGGGGGAHMIVKTRGSLPACSLKSAGRKGRQTHKMCTCTQSLPTFLATPSNFISLPLGNLLKTIS